MSANSLGVGNQTEGIVELRAQPGRNSFVAQVCTMTQFGDGARERALAKRGCGTFPAVPSRDAVRFLTRMTNNLIHKARREKASARIKADFIRQGLVSGCCTFDTLRIEMMSHGTLPYNPKVPPSFPRRRS